MLFCSYIENENNNFLFFKVFADKLNLTLHENLLLWQCLYQTAFHRFGPNWQQLNCLYTEFPLLSCSSYKVVWWFPIFIVIVYEKMFTAQNEYFFKVFTVYNEMLFTWVVYFIIDTQHDFIIPMREWTYLFIVFWNLQGI